jgi:hypothetical protein
VGNLVLSVDEAWKVQKKSCSACLCVVILGLGAPESASAQPERTAGRGGN